MSEYEKLIEYVKGVIAGLTKCRQNHHQLEFLTIAERAKTECVGAATYQLVQLRITSEEYSALIG